MCLLFDPRGDALVRGLWSRLEEAGVRTLQEHTHRGHHPHLSYAVLLDWRIEDVRAALSELPDGGPFALTCQGAVVFPRGRVALAPAVPASVIARQEAVARALVATGAELHKHYRPGHWVPHVSIATRANGTHLPLVTSAIADTVPLPLHVERAALVDSSTGETWPLPVLP